MSAVVEAPDHGGTAAEATFGAVGVQVPIVMTPVASQFLCRRLARHVLILDNLREDEAVLPYLCSFALASLVIALIKLGDTVRLPVPILGAHETRRVVTAVRV